MTSLRDADLGKAIDQLPFSQVAREGIKAFIFKKKATDVRRAGVHFQNTSLTQLCCFMDTYENLAMRVVEDASPAVCVFSDM